MTDMGSDATTLLLGAVIGAGGAIIAQFTSASYTARRDRTRLEWEQKKQDREWQMRQDERFLNLKRELYSEFMIYTGQLIDYLREREFQEPPADALSTSYEDLRRVYSNIRLIAPMDVIEVASRTVKAIGMAMAVKVVPESEDAMEIVRSSTLSAEEVSIEIQLVMRADLLGAYDAMIKGFPALQNRVRATAEEAAGTN